MKQASRNQYWIVAALCAVWLAGCSKSPESTVESFFRALSHGEIAEAQTYVSRELVGMLGPQKLSAALSDQANSIKRCGGIKDIAVNLKGEGDVRAGTVSISYGGNCQQKIENTMLVKEDGNWKITASK